MMFIANICLGASLVVYDAILCEIAGPDERDEVSSRGWALGYLGGGLLLAANLALVTLLPFGLDTAMAVRISMLSAGHLVGRLHDHPLPRHPQPRAACGRA